MARRLRQGIPPADHAESLTSAESRSSHEMFGAGFDYTQKIRVCGENPLPHPAHAVAEGSVMPRRLWQGIPPADHAESLSCAESRSGHEIFVAGFDHTQKIRVCRENLRHIRLTARPMDKASRQTRVLECVPPSPRGEGGVRGRHALPGPLSSGCGRSHKRKSRGGPETAQTNATQGGPGRACRPRTPPV